MRISRNAVIGRTHRIRATYADDDEDAVFKPDNRNGGMPAKWWAK